MNRAHAARFVQRSAPLPFIGDTSSSVRHFWKESLKDLCNNEVGLEPIDVGKAYLV